MRIKKDGEQRVQGKWVELGVLYVCGARGMRVMGPRMANCCTDDIPSSGLA